MDLDSNKIEFNIKLNAAGRDAYETELRSIKLGTRDIVYSVKYTPEINESSPFDKTNAYIMTVTLDQTSLKNTPNCTNKALTITFMNGTVDKTSIILTVKNPTKALALTASASAGAVGKTKVTVSTSLGKNNAYCYLITSDSMADKVFVEDMISNYPAAQPFSSGDEITVAENTYLTIIEYNTVTGHFVKYKTIPVTSQIIGK